MEPTDDDEAMEVLHKTVTRHPLNRNVLYNVLDCCRQERTVQELDAEASNWPQTAQSTQNPYRLACFLEKAGGLRRIERDANGEEVTEERKEGLSADEADDLVSTVGFATTDLGRAYVERYSLAGKTAALLEAEPRNAEAFRRLLSFIGKEPRTYTQIQRVFKEEPCLEAALGDGTQRVQPSVFVDKLADAGAIVWDADGWVLTEQGAAMVATAAGNQ